MLVLMRNKGERVVMETSDGSVVIRIVDVCGHKVRMSFDAPKHIRIDREEIAEQKEICPDGRRCRRAECVKCQRRLQETGGLKVR